MIQIVDPVKMAVPGIAVSSDFTWHVVDVTKLEAYRLGASQYLLFPRTSDIGSDKPLIVAIKDAGQPQPAPWPIRDLLPGEYVGKLGPTDPLMHVLRDVPGPSDSGGTFTDDDRRLLRAIAAKLGIAQ